MKFLSPIYYLSIFCRVLGDSLVIAKDYWNWSVEEASKDYFMLRRELNDKATHKTTNKN